MKKAAEMTEAEIREAYEKMRARREARLAYAKLHRKPMTADQLTRRAQYSKEYRLNQRDISLRMRVLDAEDKLEKELIVRVEELGPGETAPKAKAKKGAKGGVH